jgi:DNA-binding Xre family transcriptional regulator
MMKIEDRKYNSKHVGSSFDDFLEEEGIKELVEFEAIKRVLAFQIKKTMEEQSITKTAMAEQMETSRAALNRLLDPSNVSVTLQTLFKAAKVLGKSLHISLEDSHLAHR